MSEFGKSGISKSGLGWTFLFLMFAVPYVWYMIAQISNRPVRSMVQTIPYTVLEKEDFDLLGRHRVSLKVRIEDRSATDAQVKGALLDIATKQDADAVLVFGYWPGDDWHDFYTAGTLEWGKNGRGWASTTELPINGSFDARRRNAQADDTPSKVTKFTDNDLKYLHTANKALVLTDKAADGYPANPSRANEQKSRAAVDAFNQVKLKTESEIEYPGWVQGEYRIPDAQLSQLLSKNEEVRAAASRGIAAYNELLQRLPSMKPSFTNVMDACNKLIAATDNFDTILKDYQKSPTQENKRLLFVAGETTKEVQKAVTPIFEEKAKEVERAIALIRDKSGR
jgi:hypothetical protein